MQIVRTPNSARAIARTLPRPLGLVPTMGALHAGHLSLVERAREENVTVAASIFVNPLQFGPNEDFERYPRSFESDCRLLEAAGVELLYAPSVEVMYPEGFESRIEVGGLASVFEGAARPGHFAGVCTVVAKLFHALEPTTAYFGQKDAQQTAVIRRMVRDLDSATRVVVCKTVREPDGLALSSRNVYLSAEERAAAPSFRRALEAVSRAILDGETDPNVARSIARAMLRPPLEIEYVAVVDPATFLEQTRLERPALIVGTVRAGSVRLLDNLSVPGDDGRDPMVTPFHRYVRAAAP
jgi:pantoate--beta-alanine ligase